MSDHGLSRWQVSILIQRNRINKLVKGLVHPKMKIVIKGVVHFKKKKNFC